MDVYCRADGVNNQSNTTHGGHPLCWHLQNIPFGCTKKGILRSPTWEGLAARVRPAPEQSLKQRPCRKCHIFSRFDRFWLRVLYFCGCLVVPGSSYRFVITNHLLCAAGGRRRCTCAYNYMFICYTALQQRFICLNQAIPTYVPPQRTPNLFFLACYAIIDARQPLRYGKWHPFW